MALANEYMLEELTAEELYQRKLTAGSNITINEQNVISATGGGSSVQYTSNYAQGDILGTLSIDGTSSAVRTPNLVEGENITITRNQQAGTITISSSAGSGDLSAHELTEEAYNVLTPAEKTNGELYLTHPATVGSSEPNKIYYNDTLYGTEGGNDVVELTQAEWDALPSSKLTDGIIYVITDGGGGGASAISDLTDVELTNLADGEILKYDATAEKWINAVESGGGTDEHAVHVPPVMFDNGGLKKMSVDNFPGLEKVYLTAEEYALLTTAQKQDLSKIYYVSPYEFYTLKDEEITIRVNGTTYEWFFNGFILTDDYYEIPQEYRQYTKNTPYQGSTAWSDNTSLTSLGIIEMGPSGYTERISAQDGNWSGSYIKNTPMYGKIVTGNGGSQTNTYSNPYDVETPILIYYGNKQYTDFDIPDPLPEVTSSDNGKVLKVISGEWDKGDIREVPVIGLGDNDKILTVESGEASWLSPKKVTHLYDEIPVSNPLYFLGNIDPSTSPLTIDMTQFAANYEELRSTDFEFVFMGGESNLINRPWRYTPIDSAPGTFSYNPTTGELTATLYGGFNSVTSIGIVYKKAIIQLNENAVITGQSGTIDCSDIPSADVLTVDNFAIVLTNVNEPNTSNTGALQIAASMSYNQTTKQFSWSVNATSFQHLQASGYVIVGNYGDPEYRLITNFTGATSSSDGYRGYVPAPLAGDENKVLKGDGTWGENANRLIQNAQIYSEDERQIGVWIDGKPLYQKTFKKASVSIGTNTFITDNVSNYISNIDQYVDYECIATDASGTYLMQYSLAHKDLTAKYDFNVSIANDEIDITTGQNFTSKTVDLYITIKYTKTTDSAGSGGYQAYGFSPIIYSEEEREVGVWIDNKPLYQKTVILPSRIDVNSNYSTVVADMSGDNIEKLVYAEVFDNNGGNDRFLTRFICSNIDIILSNDKKIYANKSGGLEQKMTGYTIQYTKTTDVAGSGSYNTLGVPMTHIDGSEQVVGTLFGETLYQKSFQTTVTIASTARAWYTLVTSSQLRVINADKVLIDATHSFIELNDSIINLNYSSIVNAAGGTTGCSYASTEDEVQVCLYGFVAGTYPVTVTIQYTKSTS